MSQVNLQDPKTAAQIYFGSIMKTIDTKEETFIECCNIMCWDNKKLKNYIKQIFDVSEFHATFPNLALNDKVCSHLRHLATNTFYELRGKTNPLSDNHLA